MNTSVRLWIAVWIVATLGLALLGVAAGSQGWSLNWLDDQVLITQIRAPRTLGAWATGALLGLAGAVAQGLFRNPLADPYLLGSASGASLAVVLVLGFAAAVGAGHILWLGELSWGALLVLAAFLGALGGVATSWFLARSSGRPTTLLLSGVVVSVLMTALSDLVVTLEPGTLRGRQLFLLGSTGLLGWSSALFLSGATAVLLWVSMRYARALDALTLGDDTAASLGLSLAWVRGAYVGIMALATACAVSQTGLIAFVGLVAPHVARRLMPLTHRVLLVFSSLVGGFLLLAADVAARSLNAPVELPVGLLTAVVGGLYLLWLLRRQDGAGS